MVTPLLWIQRCSNAGDLNSTKDSNPATATDPEVTKVEFRMFNHVKPEHRGFPGGAVVENLPANAGDTGSSRGLGRSHMPRSNCAREPQLLSLRVWSLCSATREAAIVRGAHRDEEWPPLAATREKPSHRNEDPT